MSKRTRTKILKSCKNNFGLNHHAEYSSSDSYFPQSYSILGKPIIFPPNLLPFLNINRLNFSGNIESYLALESKFDIDYNKVNDARLCFKGSIQNQGKQCINLLTFGLGMICYCCFRILEHPNYRNRFFTIYSFNNYQQIISIIKKIYNCQTLVLTFQDNNLNLQQLDKLEQLFINSSLNDITIRNLTYCTRSKQQIQKYFLKIRSLKQKKIKFIWQKIVVTNFSLSDKTYQIESLLHCDANQ